ncbi:MAG: DUF1003 domain-containing protein [Corynebacterium sp.]|nr:DUF1003 domain-containing protein [Corynebacterium sp.]
MGEYIRSDLDTPLLRTKRQRFKFDDDTIGTYAEKVARFFGTGQYLFWQTIFVIIWIMLNVGGFVWNWDPYPFILLNLAFSTQAAYAAPLILLAQNQQEDRDRVTILADRRRAEETKADTEFLARELAGVRLAVGDMVTRDYLRHELEDLRNLLERVEAKLDDAVASRIMDPQDFNAPTQGDIAE